jgi:hypothetical protein
MKVGGWSFASSGTWLALLLAITVAGCVAWLMLPGPSDAEDQSEPATSAVIRLAQNAFWSDPAATPTEANLVGPIQATAPADAAVPAPAASPPDALAERAPIDGVRISSQSWRRGGLGSKALVTFTLRNRNDYAIRDIEIACAFTRRDGSHLTDRKRVIRDTVGVKSRKTYAGMLVGFVNVNANKAKCSLVTASRI